MKTQDSCKEPKECVHCDGIIATTAKRRVDGRMHRHLDCNIKEEFKRGDNELLTQLTNDWIST